jgi:F0F1-type ATP synthase epsilon subunit
VFELGLTVLSPAGKLLDEAQVDWVRVRLADGGGIGILPGHAPLIAETVSAPLVFSRDGEEHRIDLQHGILQVETGRVVILTGGEAGGLQVDKWGEADEVRFDRLARVLLARLRLEREEDTGGPKG